MLNLDTWWIKKTQEGSQATRLKVRGLQLNLFFAKIEPHISGKKTTFLKLSVEGKPSVEH